MIKRIGVELKAGCDIQGGELAIQSLKDVLDFDVSIAVDPSKLKEEEPIFLSAVSDLIQRLKDIVITTLKAGHFPLVYGGDHALAIGSIAASLTLETGVLWIDSHGDCNTLESSPSHHIHGMPLAVLQGYGHPELTKMNQIVLKGRDILQIGIRALDQQEAIQMKAWGIRSITMREIQSKGYDWLLQEIQPFIDQHPRLHVSFDCDSIDPKEAPGVNTPYEDGLSIDMVMALLKALPFEKVFSMDIVEFNPLRDNGSTKSMIMNIDRLVSQKKGNL